MTYISFHVKICAILLFISVSGCKYEDGPSISLKSRETRVAGEYDIAKFEVGGINLTDSLKVKLCFSKLRFSKDGTFKNTSEIDSCRFFGDWVLSHNDEKLGIQFFVVDTLIEPLGSKWVLHWKILKLTDEEINLSITHENKFVLLHLKQ